MELTDEQKEQVAQWIAGGMELSALQKKLAEDFSLNMTFMEVRFLVDDLNIDLPVEEEPAEKEESADEEDVLSDAELLGEVSVTVEKIARPGAALSGSVTFSDGETVEWQLDPMGRLGLIPKKDGYQPPEEDIPVFQEKLREAISKQGMM